ncbi:hypothetical protein ASZ96_09220 [Brucella melitensis]|nr:hypothetical protein ASZ96_09220 [Brucella melitensis]
MKTNIEHFQRKCEAVSRGIMLESKLSVSSESAKMVSRPGMHETKITPAGPVRYELKEKAHAPR